MDHCCDTTQENGKHEHQDHHDMMVSDFRKRFWVSLILSVPILLLSPMIQQWLALPEWNVSGDTYFVFILATIIFIYGGWPFLKGLTSEISFKRPGMMTLVAIGISAAYLYSLAVFLGFRGMDLLWEMATLVDIMLLGHWIEMKSVMGASRALEELAKLMPRIAHKVISGRMEDISVEELNIGDRVLIKPGEKVPVDGIVIDGVTTVNESMLTGETQPVLKKSGNEVVGGSLNGDGSIIVTITKVGKETYLSQIIDLVKHAQEHKSKTQNLANRAALWLTIVALTGGIVTLFAWLMVTSQDLAYALERTIAVIVIACPHALGLAIPLVVSFSTSLSAQHGILIRNRDAFEQARNVDAVIFDKTGTLTWGTFGISDVVSFSDLKKEEILTLAGSLEKQSEHPIANAIMLAAQGKKEVKEFKALPGRGVEGIIDGKKVEVVSPAYLAEQRIAISHVSVTKLLDSGKTVVYVVVNGEVVGAIALDDVIREEAYEAVERLRRVGIEPIMLTGDGQAVAARVAQKIGITEFYGEVLPDKKAEVIKNIQTNGRIVAMVGDGVNDAPALAQADVGIAIGAGTDVAIETADIVLVKSDPRDVVSVIQFGTQTYRKMIQNLWWATGYNILALPLAAGVLAGVGIELSPAVGAILMSLSTIVVAVNATLLKFNTL